MGLYLQMVDFDEMFSNLPMQPIIVNDYNTNIPEEKEELYRRLYSHYQDTDIIEESASCDCGKITGMYNHGVLCTTCNSKVTNTTDKEIESILWMRAPEGIVSLISPNVWKMLESAMKAKGFNFLEYLTNTNVHFEVERITSKETLKKLDRFMNRNLPRGYNNFITHFDEIMTFMFQANIIDSNNANKNELWECIQQNKHVFFPKYLPIPSRICLVVESTTSGVYIDKPLGMAMDAILTLTSIKSSDLPTEGYNGRLDYTRQNRVAKTIRELAKFYDVYTKERIAKKPGMVRRHVVGSRLHFTGRAVITSLSDPHDYDEIHIPWGMAAQLLKYHIINKLLKRGYSADKAIEFVYSNVLRYNHELDLIFQELINETIPLDIHGDKRNGLVCILQRNQFTNSNLGFLVIER